MLLYTLGFVEVPYAVQEIVPGRLRRDQGVVVLGPTAGATVEATAPESDPERGAVVANLGEVGTGDGGHGGRDGHAISFSAASIMACQTSTAVSLTTCVEPSSNSSAGKPAPARDIATVGSRIASTAARTCGTYSRQ